MNKSCKLIMVALASIYLAGCYGRFEPYVKPAFAMGRDGVVVPACRPYDTGDLAAPELDCFVASARMQSLVYPEKMVQENQPHSQRQNQAQP